MFYIVSEDGQIIEQSWGCPTMEWLSALAHECKCDLWVIEGEHSGITYTRPDTNEAEDA